MKKTLIKTAFTLLIAFFANYSFAQNTSFIGPKTGTLIIVGGGNVGPEIWSEFIEKAGGTNAKIVYMPPTPEKILPSLKIDLAMLIN